MASGTEDWERYVERMQEAYASALRRNVEAQAEFAETWTDAVEESVEGGLPEDGTESAVAAYEIWMDAAEEAVERSADLAAGEDVEPEEFRDLWLEAANDAFKRVMGSEAFAAATGQALEEAFELQRETADATEDALHEWGFATAGDVTEVGERLVELERRQHAVERKLDRILDALPDGQTGAGEQ